MDSNSPDLIPVNEFDCVVVGSGNAGCCAAFSATEAGCKKVLVVDVCPPEWAGGNGYFTSGAFRTTHGGLQDLLFVVNKMSEEQVGSIDIDCYTRDDFLKDILGHSNGKPDPVLTELVDASRDTLSWLATSVGLPFQVSIDQPASASQRHKVPGATVLRTEDGGRGLIAAHLRALDKAKVDVWFNCPATGIIMEDGAVRGIVVERDGKEIRLRAPAVVLAAGSFESNPILREKYLGSGWERAMVRGTPYNQGAAFALAATVGARQAGNWAGCHTTCWNANAPSAGQRSLTNQSTRLGYPLGIMVNSKGKRFVDCGEDYGKKTYSKFGRAILGQPGGFAFQVFDSKVIGLLPQEEYGASKNILADRLEDLADAMLLVGLDSKEEFIQTVNQFNAAVKDRQVENPELAWNPAVKDGLSTDSSLSVPKSNWALTIDQPPFMAVKVACGVTFTFGGVAIEPETAGVISDASSLPIPGLFCTGEMVGLFRENHPSGSGLMAGAVFGRKAGRAAAKLVAK
ncbi:FAD binding domain-containing protein [Mycena crocata]|nr:FAD binding domain-containing protein [Mycena crocata]